jgi:hypothetical protein
MDLRRTGRIFGWLFIGTFVTSIPARLLFIDGAGASWSNMHFVSQDASSSSLKLGALLEFGLIVTQIGTAVVLFPIGRHRSHHGVRLRRDRSHQHALGGVHLERVGRSQRQ